MLVQRRGLMSACLCFFCLLAVTQRLVAQNCIQGILRTVQLFIKKVPMKLTDCRLYTPSIVHYQNCPQTTMQCFADEVKVLIEELKTIEAPSLPDLNKMLDRLAQTLNQNNSECPQCELLQEEKAADFLQALRQTLTLMSNEPGICST